MFFDGLKREVVVVGWGTNWAPKEFLECTVFTFLLGGLRRVRHSLLDLRLPFIDDRKTTVRYSFQLF